MLRSVLREEGTLVGPSIERKTDGALSGAEQGEIDKKSLSRLDTCA